MTMIASTALRNAARVGSRRQMSTAAPKTHKAKDAWVELQKTRPPPGHEHVRRENVRPIIFRVQRRRTVPEKADQFLDLGFNDF